MRLFPPHFTHPALFQSALRHTAARSKITSTPTRARIPRPRILCSQAFTLPADDDMGKEDKASKNFNLKVPKGTRDCRCSHTSRCSCAVR
jgi:histidyl-tRNA synthetase